MMRLLQGCCAVLIAALSPGWVPQASAQPKPAPAVLRVAYIPIANYTALLVARDKGYFAEENLSVTWSPVAQGAVAVEAVFGGVELDLRDAGMKGDEAYVEANAVFGGIEIRVPESWQVIPRGAGVFGGFTDETRAPEANASAPVKRLIVKGAAVFGGVMITNSDSRGWRRHRYR